ncbi:MAG: UDP-N-acetylmuramoyl-tripeptide--D-alanyl-D-alanine ligase [Rhodocyclales bacterium]|nr:UDP-N-acetylmuramoyl-tripeptide--D-alanyl-D-alanine ligase [Rhodocyclales bacterium]
MMTLFEAARILGGQASSDVRFASVGTDSRNVSAGELFVALRGERFDGHEFVQAAGAAGAAAALVDRQWVDARQDRSLPVLVVDDTRAALGQLAANWRARLDIALIGVTGSNGKTTVKEMCRAIMNAQMRLAGHADDAVLATEGNLNNDIGLPLTLLRLRARHRVAVVEMGMNHPGEIAALTQLAHPTVAIVTNAQRAHLLGLGSVTKVAEEKGAIYAGLGDTGVAVINADDVHAAYWTGLNGARRIVTFGMLNPADVRGACSVHGLHTSLTLTTPEGVASIALQVPGQHNARNAVGAAAACIAAGASLRAVSEGLAGFRGARGRLQAGPGLKGAIVIDDSYNANPDSVRAAIDVLAATPGYKILVLGDMGEIGDTSAQVHDEIGGYAKSMGIDGLYGFGDMSMVAVRNFGDGGRHYKALDALVDALTRELDENTVVLVKGSRFMRMERVAAALTAPNGNNAADPLGGSDAA